MQLLEDGVPLVPPAGQTYRLRLYVAGQTPKSVLAFRNLKQICEEHLHGHYEIEIIDLLQNPQLAQGDQILAILGTRMLATGKLPGATATTAEPEVGRASYPWSPAARSTPADLYVRRFMISPAPRAAAC